VTSSRSAPTAPGRERAPQQRHTHRIRDETPTPTPTARPPGPQRPACPDTAGSAALAHHLTDPDVEIAVQTLAAQAPPMTEDQRARLARLLHLYPARTGRPPAPRSPAQSPAQPPARSPTC